MELEKKRTFGWDDYLVQPWLYLFFSLNGPSAGYNLPLRVILWNGRQIDMGKFKKPKIVVNIKNWRGLWLILRPNLNSIGEAYMHEEIDIDGKLEDIVEIGFKLVTQMNPTESAFEKYTRMLDHSRVFDRDSVRHHYDIGNAVYRLFLDETMVYSCAYFENGDETLDEAQIKKVDHILQKAQLKPGHRLLDIGCGWGTAVIHAAKNYGVTCVGVTISQAQFDLATERVKEAGVGDRVEIRLQDYRDIQGKFDRIISVGMFEHLGQKHLVEYFKQVNSLLAEDGMVLNHGLNARSDQGFSGGTDFIQRFIFPGSYLPTLGEAVQAAEDGGFEILDIENLRKHYTQTMIKWASNYEKNSEAIRAMVGETKFRAWRMYLGGSVRSFVTNNVHITQLLMHRSGKHPDTIAPNRRYMYCSPPNP